MIRQLLISILLLLVGLSVGWYIGNGRGPGSVPGGFTAQDNNVQVTNASKSAAWPCASATPCPLAMTASFQFVTSKPTANASCGSDPNCLSFTDSTDGSPGAVATTAAEAPCWGKPKSLYVLGTISFSPWLGNKNASSASNSASP
jgi:hypothetical protein